MTLAVARLRAEQINRAVIGTLAERRAKMGEGRGERLAAPARPEMGLSYLKEQPRPETLGATPDQDEYAKDARPEAITTPGYLTSVRKLPDVIAKKPERDPRRVAAFAYAEASEKLGAMAGMSVEGGGGGGGPASSDGAVTTRLKFATTVAAVHKVLGEVGSALTPNARGGKGRRAISSRELMDAICIDALPLVSLLKAAGWSGQRRDVAHLTQSAEICLELMARALSIVPEGAPLPDDLDIPDDLAQLYGTKQKNT